MFTLPCLRARKISHGCSWTATPRTSASGSFTLGWRNHPRVNGRTASISKREADPSRLPIPGREIYDQEKARAWRSGTKNSNQDGSAAATRGWREIHRSDRSFSDDNVDSLAATNVDTIAEVDLIVPRSLAFATANMVFSQIATRVQCPMGHKHWRCF